MKRIGYARVSKEEQSLALQVDALKRAGCDPIFTDQGVSGAVHPHKRPGFAAAMEGLAAGDALIVWKLDRLGRSLPDLLGLMGEFNDKGIEFTSITDGIDTTTLGGKLVYQVMGALAEFERGLLQERTKAGLAAAKERGKRLGRPLALQTHQIRHAAKEIEAGRQTVSSMAEILSVDRGTLRRALKAVHLLLVIALFSVSSAMAGESVRVIDGDGLKIGDQSIRLWGIDAPELDQTCEQDGRTVPCGEDARFLLGALVMGGDLVCETKGTDRYRRIIAQCSAGGHDLAGEMVRNGYALDWPKYSKGFYAEQQTEAKANKRGLWAGTFVYPWDWR